MKTLWVINFFAGNRDSGWGERHFFLAKELIRKENYEVVIVSSSYNHMFERFPQINATFNFEEYEGVKFCWVKTPRYNPKSILRFWAMIVFSAKLFWFPFKSVARPNYILMSSMPLFPILPAWYLKMRLKAEKLAFEVRDLWPLTPIFLGDVSPYNPMILVMRLCEYFGYKKADIILSLLPKADVHINTISKNPDKFFYLPNGISEDVNTNESLPFSLDNLPSWKFIVGYAGTIGVANAMEYVINAARLMAAIRDVHFVVVGDGYLKDDLIRMAEGLDNITFLPKVKKGQVSQVIQRFDIGIISWHNSALYKYGVSANKFFDYMLEAKPILVAGHLEMNPVDQAGCGIVVAPENPELIRDGILTLKNLPTEKLKELGLNGQNYVRNYHSYEFLADKLDSIFRNGSIELDKQVTT